MSVPIDQVHSLKSQQAIVVRKLAWWAALAALGCAAIWAGQSVAVKVALKGIPPITIMALRFMMALPIVYVVSRLMRVSIKPVGNEWKALTLSGVLLCTQICLFTLGTNATTSVHSTILINSFPFFAAFAGHFILKGHKLTPRIILGIAIAFSGIPLLVLEGRDHSQSGSLLGNIMVVGAAFFVGTKIVVMKRILEHMHPVKLAFWDGTAAVLIFGVIALTTESNEPFNLSSAVVGGMIYQGLVVSAMGFLVWLFLLSKFSANQLNVFRLFTPPLGVILGTVILKEPVSHYALTSLLLVCAGLYFVLKGSTSEPQPNPSG
ncbi:MAG: DMT family transporter [Verrucomicrobiota bacterium]